MMMTQNVKTSLEKSEQDAKQQHENLSLELFTLCSKVESPTRDKYVDLSFYELDLIKNGLIFLADFIYKMSLKEKHRAQYYDSCNLKLIKIREKIKTIETYAMC